MCVCVCARAVRGGHQTQDHAAGAAEDVHVPHGELAAWLSDVSRCREPTPTVCAQESERKAYNPRPFCKTYTMDKQPLNTGEQKDMTEFFTDLITKIEEMNQELVNRRLTGSCFRDNRLPLEQHLCLVVQKNTVKSLFGGVITNNVVSLVSSQVLEGQWW